MPSRTELLQDTFDRIQRKETRLRAAPTDESTLREIEQQIQTLASLDTPPPGTTTEIMRLGREKIRIGKTLREFSERLKRLESARVRIDTLLEARSLTGLTAEQLAIYIELLEVQELGGFGDVDVGQTFWREYVESTPTNDARFERVFRAITDPASVKAEAKARLVKVEKRQAPDQQPPEPEGGQTHLEVLTTLLNTSSADKPLTIEEIYTHVWGGEYPPKKAGMVYNLVSAARRHSPGIKIVKSKDGYYQTVLEPATGEPSQIEAVAAVRAPNRSPRENTHTSRILKALRSGPLTVIDIYRILYPDFKGDELDRAQMQRAYRTLHELREKLPIGFRVVLIDGKYNLEYPLGLTPDSVDILACALQANLMMFTKLVEELAPAEPPLTVISNLALECLARGTTLDVSTTSQIDHRKDLLKRREALFMRIGQILGGEMGNAVTQLENSNPQLLVLLNYLAQLNRIRVRFPSHPDVNREITAYDLLSEICINDGPNIFKGRVPLRRLAVAPYTEPEQQAQPATPTTIVNFVDRLPNPVKPLVAAGEVAPAVATDLAAEQPQPKKEKKPRHHETPPTPKIERKSKPPRNSMQRYRGELEAEIEFLRSRLGTTDADEQTRLYKLGELVNSVGAGARAGTIDPLLAIFGEVELDGNVPLYNFSRIAAALFLRDNARATDILPANLRKKVPEWIEIILGEQREARKRKNGLG